MMKNFVAASIVLCGMAGSGCNKTEGPTSEAKMATVGQMPLGDKAAAGPKKIAVDLGGGVKMEMTLIPAGEFLMGSGESAEETAAFFQKNSGYF